MPAQRSQAENPVLLRHGFSRPPDEHRAPEAARVWRQTLGRKLTHVIPHLRDRPEPKNRSSFTHGMSGLTSPSWHGAVALTGGPFNFCAGSWIVPDVTAAGTGDGDWWSLAWAGIDGGGDDFLQCGTAHHVSREGGVTRTEYFAWFDGAPSGWTEITNLAVNPGDAICATLRYFGLTKAAGKATATVTNLTTGRSAAVALTPPRGVVLPGNCAAWIVERPVIGGRLASLPESAQIIFHNTLACTANSSITGAQAQPVTMAGGSETPPAGAAQNRNFTTAS
jgi:hypothetical protein